MLGAGPAAAMVQVEGAFTRGSYGAEDPSSCRFIHQTHSARCTALLVICGNTKTIRCTVSKRRTVCCLVGGLRTAGLVMISGCSEHAETHVPGLTSAAWTSLAFALWPEWRRF